MTTWVLNTHGEPLTTSREFLHHVWMEAGLTGMLIPMYPDGRAEIAYTLIDDPARLVNSNPFVPLMQANAGKIVARLASEQPDAHFAAVLHPCEMRALDELIKKESLHLENWLIIGTECLACFPEDDFEWRVEVAGDIERLTNMVLRNARQGGIATDRYRQACQICIKPEPLHVDLSIGILGLPIKETMLVFSKNDILTDELSLAKITDGPAPLALIAQHDHILNVIEDRRKRARARMLRDLPADLPSTLDELVKFLMNCQPCQKCLEACPVQTNEVIPAISTGMVSLESARQWLLACAECGMCEQACPKGIPLAAITNRIGHALKLEVLAL